MSANNNSIIEKVLSWFGFRVMAAWFGVYIKDKIEASITEPLVEVDEKVAEAVSHIPNGLTPMSESDWEETEPADQHIYMVFPDEQVTESES